MKREFRKFVESVRMRLVSTPVWADVMVLADLMEQDPDGAEPAGALSDLVQAEMRRRASLQG
jgi:hypothetical protein